MPSMKRKSPKPLQIQGLRKIYKIYKKDIIGLRNKTAEKKLCLRNNCVCNSAPGRYVMHLSAKYICASAFTKKIFAKQLRYSIIAL